MLLPALLPVLTGSRSTTRWLCAAAGYSVGLLSGGWRFWADGILRRAGRRVLAAAAASLVVGNRARNTRQEQDRRTSTDWGRDGGPPAAGGAGLTRDQLAAMCGTHPRPSATWKPGSVRSPYHSTATAPGFAKPLACRCRSEGPADDRVVLCLTGADAPAVVRILSASLFEFVRRRADAAALPRIDPRGEAWRRSVRCGSRRR